MVTIPEFLQKELVERIQIAVDDSERFEPGEQKDNEQALALVERGYVNLTTDDPNILFLIETYIDDLEDSDQGVQLRNLIRTFQIEAGIYREISQEELARTTVSHGKLYAFKLDGKKYIFSNHMGDNKA